MRIHTFPTHNPKECPVFDYLKSGEKTVEGRPYSRKYHGLKSGDTIVFVSGDRKVKMVIKSIKRYKTLENYLRKETLSKALPGVSSVKKATEIYNKWSSPAKRRKLKSKYGFSMLAIRVASPSPA